jgi:hypothetical protein
MKKLQLLILLFFITSFIHAQFNLSKIDGTPINDGDVFTFNTNQYPDANLEFAIENTTNQDIGVVIEVVSISNTNGSGMELCFGLCYAGITVNTVYPTDGPRNIPANSTISNGNHFLNTASSPNGEVLEYVFKFKQVDANGNQVGDSVTITYRYDPNAAGVENYNSGIDYSIYPSVITNNNLNIRTTKNLTMTVLDLQGKTIKQVEIKPSTDRINVSYLNPGIYFLLISDEQGKKELLKIIKR